MLLLCTFVLLALLSFTIVVVLLRPRAADRQNDIRLQTVLGPRGALEAVASAQIELAEASIKGPFSWIDDSLRDNSLFRRLQILIYQAKSSWQPGGVIAITVVTTAVCTLATYLLLSNVLFALPVTALCLITPFAFLRWQRSRCLARFEKVLPDAIDMCARSLRAGHSVVAAIGIVAEEAPEPAKSEFAEVFRKQNYGVAMRDALIQMMERVPSRDLQIVITAILVQKDTGGNLAEIMDRVVNVIRDRARIQAEVRTHTAQGRFTGWVLCLLPVILLVLINLISPGYSRVLFQEGAGRTLLYTGLGLLALGAFTIRHIVNGIEV
jgi:tight adherence protein B